MDARLLQKQTALGAQKKGTCDQKKGGGGTPPSGGKKEERKAHLPSLKVRKTAHRPCHGQKKKGSNGVFLRGGRPALKEKRTPKLRGRKRRHEIEREEGIHLGGGGGEGDEEGIDSCCFVKRGFRFIEVF